jgi:hypothetical protein
MSAMFPAPHTTVGKLAEKPSLIQDCGEDVHMYQEVSMGQTPQPFPHGFNASLVSTATALAAHSHGEKLALLAPGTPGYLVGLSSPRPAKAAEAPAPAWSLAHEADLGAPVRKADDGQSGAFKGDDQPNLRKDYKSELRQLFDTIGQKRTAAGVLKGLGEQVKGLRTADDNVFGNSSDKTSTLSTLHLMNASSTLPEEPAHSRSPLIRPTTTPTTGRPAVVVQGRVVASRPSSKAVPSFRGRSSSPPRTSRSSSSRILCGRTWRTRCASTRASRWCSSMTRTAWSTSRCTRT